MIIRCLKWIVFQIRYNAHRFSSRFHTYKEACITMLVRTHVRRWEKVAKAGRPFWDERNEIIASHIPAGSSVLDVGCGAQTLKQHLKPGCHYQPCDVVKSTPEVIFCDFNAGIYPEVTKSFDFVICSGVLEYIREPEDFLRRIPRLGRAVIISYVPLPPGGSKLDRLGNGWGWVNHFTKGELQDVFLKTGSQFQVLCDHKDGYSIFLLTPNATTFSSK